MLKVTNLSKTYFGSKVKAVDSLSFEVKEGEIFGLLGLNGAGKSTAFKCIAGIQPLDEGKIEICGYDIVKDELKAKTNFAFIPDNHSVFEELTGREYVSFMANVYKVSKKDMEERLNLLCDLFDSSSYIDNQISSYSHGMKQKIAIIGGIIHFPKLWILDEPLLGLDPKSIKQIQTFMKDYVSKGNSILFSSHILDTVNKMCDRVLIINKGQSMGLFDLNEEKQKEDFDLSKVFFDIVGQ